MSTPVTLAVSKVRAVMEERVVAASRQSLKLGMDAAAAMSMLSPCRISRTRTKPSCSPNGRGSSQNELARANMAVAAAIPRARERAATEETTGVFHNMRKPNFRSCRMVPIRRSIRGMILGPWSRGCMRHYGGDRGEVSFTRRMERVS
jgi:hypothetical protein